MCAIFARSEAGRKSGLRKPRDDTGLTSVASSEVRETLPCRSWLTSLAHWMSKSGICSVNLAPQERENSIGHPLEETLNAPARDILDAISSGFRAQVDVKGKLAELYLYRRLEVLHRRSVISELRWSDRDGDPDFFLCYKGHHLTIQCKNARSGKERCKGGEAGSFRVELQKTRSGVDIKTGEKTRLYRPDEFDIVAVCLFNQKRVWEYVYAAAGDMARHHTQTDRLQVMHPICQPSVSPWHDDLMEVLEALHLSIA